MTHTHDSTEEIKFCGKCTTTPEEEGKSESDWTPKGTATLPADTLDEIVRDYTSIDYPRNKSELRWRMLGLKKEWINEITKDVYEAGKRNGEIEGHKKACCEFIPEVAEAYERGKKEERQRILNILENSRGMCGSVIHDNLIDDLKLGK